MAKSVLQLQNVSKYYYSETAVTQALRKVNLEFRMGEFVAITGESGSGKSTLLNIMSGLDTFDEGEMYFKGEPTFQFDGQDWEEYRRNQIGFVFQDYSLIGHYTALDNVAAALVIQERETAEAEQLALGYLEKVGLKEFARQRASQLSSGQKQRLAIARALAKNTDIIVADEPTGNLDSETGIQVVQLLEKLSKEKLVIMVTHNYEQAEPYVTRKIRLHDGEVVTDVPVEKTADETEDDVSVAAGEEKGPEAENGTVKKKGGMNRLAGFFAWKNIRMQKGRSALFFCFFLMTAVTSFLFIGELLHYADDRVTKEYDRSAYQQENAVRLAIRYPDGRAMTEKDADKIRSLKNVEEVDLYDYANDVRYYFQEGKGYEYVYGYTEPEGVTGQDESEDMMMAAGGASEEMQPAEEEKSGEMPESSEETSEEVKSVHFLTEDLFMKSSSCLTESDLREGRLPKARNEIVLYSSDKKTLGQEQECYFTADNIWGEKESYHTKVKVVGLLKKKTDQIYFDCSLCQMITAGLDMEFSLEYFWEEKMKQYLGYMTFYPVIADDLKGREIRISSKYKSPSNSYQLLPTDLRKAFAGSSLLHVSDIDDEGTVTEQTGVLMGEDGQIYVPGGMGTVQKKEGLEVTAQTDRFTEQGAGIIEMSEKLFWQLYNKKSTQASAYISSYSKTDSVLDELVAMGYDALSTYRVSSTNYIEKKVYQRLEVIGISCLVLIVLTILQILLVRSILKIKIKDYHVLKFMGMRVGQMNRITYLEMGVHCIMAIIAALAAMAALYTSRMLFIVDLLQYYTLLGLFLFVVYNIVLMLMTVFFFNRLLKRRV